MSEGNGYATRDTIIGGVPRRRYTVVELPGHGKFRLRSLSVLECNSIPAQYLAEADAEQKVREIALTNCRWVVACWVDNEGDRILKDADVNELSDQDGAFVNALAGLCEAHCTDEASVEDAEKN